MNAPAGCLKPSHAATAIIATLGLALPWWRLMTYGCAVRQGRVPRSRSIAAGVALPVLGTILLERLLERAGKKSPRRRGRIPTARFATAVVVAVELLWLIALIAIAGRIVLAALAGHAQDVPAVDTLSDAWTNFVGSISYALLVAAICAAAVVRIECAWRNLETESTTSCGNLPLQLTSAFAGAGVTFQLVGHHSPFYVTLLAVIAVWFTYMDAVRLEERPPQSWARLWSPPFVVHAIGMQAWAFTALGLLILALCLTSWMTFREEPGSSEHSRLYQVALLDLNPTDPAIRATPHPDHHIDVSVDADARAPKKFSVTLTFNFAFDHETEVRALLIDDSAGAPVCRINEQIVPVESFDNYIASGFVVTFPITQEIVDRPAATQFTCRYMPRYDFAQLESYSARSFELRVLRLRGASVGPPGDIVRTGTLLPFVVDLRSFRRGESIVVTGGRWAEDERLRKLKVPDFGRTEDDDSLLTVRWEDPWFVERRDGIVIIIGALYALMAAAVLEWIRLPFNAAAVDTGSADPSAGSDDLHDDDEG